MAYVAADLLIPSAPTPVKALLATALTAVGSNALDNFRSLGHITIYFDGAEEAKLPGTVHLLGHLPADTLTEDSDFIIETC